MADVKITALTAISANPVNPATFPIPMVDLLDNTITASGTTKKVTVNQILGAGGTATLASATITGALTVDTSTLVVDATNNRVGVVNASPTYPLDVVGTGRFVQTNFADNILRISTGGSTTGNLNQILFADQATTATSAITAYNSAFGSGKNYALGFTTNGSERGLIDSSGNFHLATGNVVMTTSGKGIDFSANTPDGSGTVGSEVLSDYEEGTWTPVVADARSGGIVGTCTIVSATYTKIGRQVSVEFYIQAIGTAGMTAGNNLTIRGFPFSAAIQAQGSFYTYRIGRNAATVSSSAFVPAGFSVVEFFTFSTNSATTDVRILVSDVVSGQSEIRMSVTYTV